MDLQKCLVLVRAVDTGSFTRAAEELGYTPSGITHMMNAMESELGFTVLHRGRTGVTLTEDGKRVLPILRELVRWNEQLLQTAGEITGVSTGHVSIGSYASISRFGLAKVITRFTQEYPGITVELLEGGQGENDEWLSKHRVDFSFISRQPYHTCDWIPIMLDDMCAVLPEKHRLAGQKEVCLNEFNEDPYIMLSAEYEQDVQRVLKAAHFKPRIRFYSQDELTVLSMVRAGLGVSVIPGIYVRKPYPGVVALPLLPRAQRQLGIGIPAMDELSPAAKKMINCVRGYGEGLLIDID